MAIKSHKDRLKLPPPLLGEIWRYRFAGSQGMRMHRHDEPEANLIAAGRARYVIKDQRYDMEPGTLLWLLPEQDHLLVEQSPGFSMWIVVFRPALLASVCSTAWSAPLRAADAPVALCRQLDGEAFERMVTLCEQVEAVKQVDSGYFNAALGHAAMALWHAFQQASQRPGAMAVHPAVEQAARLLRDTDATLSLEALGRAVGLSPPRLSRLFGRQMGIGLGAYRNRQRLDRFFRIYGRGQRHTLLSAALDAGFGSYPQFHRVFKAMIGCSPAAYRKRMACDAAPSGAALSADVRDDAHGN